MPVTLQNVDDVFTYHAPDADQRVAYEKIRTEARGLARAYLELAPNCADLQAALRLLRESVMTVNAAIALKGSI